MYGLINISVKNLVTEKFGHQKWEQIYERAGLENDIFLSNKTYDDQITYRLVTASSEVLGISAEEILKEFGRYWVLNVAPTGYGKLLEAGGRTYDEFLLNLPSFHTRVMLIYPEVRPPNFEVSMLEDGRLRIVYGSARPGLLPFIFGLLDGLAERFKVTTDVQYVGQNQINATHEFIITKTSNAHI